MRIGQEALTNTLKYAHANTFETQLVCHAKKLRLEFQDDGDGFNIKDQHDGVGLTGIRERVAQMGGELKISSARGKGTKITVALPCNGDSRVPVDDDEVISESGASIPTMGSRPSSFVDLVSRCALPIRPPDA
jgi:signal transduction histidine kinase